MKKEIFIGKVGIGGKNPVSIQSMTSTKTSDINSTLRQIKRLKKDGCDIIRIAIPDKSSLSSFKILTKTSPLPVIADIHFNSFLALKAIEYGAKGIRINPGNIKNKQKIKEIITLAGQYQIPIRIGINWGSIDKKKINPSKSNAENMVNNAIDHIKFFEDHNFNLIKISLKSSNIYDTVDAYTLMDQKCDYPLHLGITEAGTYFPGSIKSAIGIGALLLKGIGNTLRVSLTANPVKEIKVAKEILKALGLLPGMIVISCPTCSRTIDNFIPFVIEIEKDLNKILLNKTLKVAIMGCEVNGPGEAKDADIGIAFSNNKGYIFKKSKIIDRVSPKDAKHVFLKYIKEMV